MEYGNVDDDTTWCVSKTDVDSSFQMYATSTVTTDYNIGIYLDKCFKSCLTPSSYKAHLYSHHENQFKCKTCNKIFPFLSGVANHKRAHLKQKLFKCFAGSCHHAFKHPQDLHPHIGMHFNTCFTCDECCHWTF